MSGDRYGDRLTTFGCVRRGAAWALVILLAACGGARGQADKQAQEVDPLHTATREELDVSKAIVAEENAWNRGDVDGFVKGFKDSPETVFMGKLVLEGYAQILADFKRNYPTAASMGELTYSELEVHAMGESFAVCLGKYHLERAKKEGGGADGTFSMVLEKTGAGWKIVLDHTT
ncbi:MAG TPA: nuclear transport factor 2 family protein [Acidobacteriaceae bacterium]|jgi:ketosteroid isomerase-like protein|nr:nuclear transport factor 2 family protein [Acidobacteriaceae bacterium]